MIEFEKINNDPEFSELQKLSELLDAQLDNIRYNKIDSLYPDKGPFRRDLYPRHVDFLNAGLKYRQRAFIAANRTGKTLTACVELSYHMTGRYPKWWKGRKFTTPPSCWAVGESNQSTKEILQAELLGTIESGGIGTGTIPKKYLGKIIQKPGVAGAVETFYVKHISGGWSSCTFKAYEQKRAKFQGTKKQVIVLDEEPIEDPDIYTECLTRTADKFNPGLVICTFTPLSSYSKTVQSFLPNMVYPQDVGLGYVDPENPYKFVVRVGWDDVPHLTEEDKQEFKASYPEHEVDARTKGIFSLGHGAIFPIPEESISVDPFPIPAYWPKAYGFDVGWKRTAAIWITQNPESRQYFLYSEHYEGQSLAPIHASAIKARGEWVWGVIDTGSKQVNPTDGHNLYEQYIDEGLNLIEAVKAKESAIIKVNEMFLSGQLKVFRTLTNFFKEKRAYRRNTDGKIAETADHLIDALLYLIIQIPHILRVAPHVEKEFEYHRLNDERDNITGY